MATNDGGPAFPVHGGHHPDDDPRNHTLGGGMSLRDWFAGQALTELGDINPNLPGSPASTQTWPDPQELAERRAKWAYLQADAMLAARQEARDAE